MQQQSMQLMRLAAFCNGDAGGNPAGVALYDRLPEPAVMQLIARDVGYSETAFAAPVEGGWRVRYFAPETEVPFCGHATIALAAALARTAGNGEYRLLLNDGAIGVTGTVGDTGMTSSLKSPPTRSAPADASLLERAMRLFGLDEDGLDRRIAPAVIEAGARHLLLPLNDRARLAAMDYDFAAGRDLMIDTGLVTIALVHAEARDRFHARNAFAVGGVLEDPATGAAAAALGGYLRDLGWLPEGSFTILQGEDMGMPSLIHVSVPPTLGEGITLTGAVRDLQS